ncbi:hypothetical protein ACN28S_01245 [Cystobacter fuscus]
MISTGFLSRGFSSRGAGAAPGVALATGTGWATKKAVRRYSIIRGLQHGVHRALEGEVPIGQGNQERLGAQAVIGALDLDALKAARRLLDGVIGDPGVRATMPEGLRTTTSPVATSCRVPRWPSSSRAVTTVTSPGALPGTRMVASKAVSSPLRS